MKRYIKATYSDGAFTPVENLDIDDGTTVRLIVLPADISSEQARRLADTVFNNLGEREIKELEQIALTSHGFSAGGMIDRSE